MNMWCTVLVKEEECFHIAFMCCGTSVDIFSTVLLVVHRKCDNIARTILIGGSRGEGDGEIDPPLAIGKKIIKNIYFLFM